MITGYAPLFAMLLLTGRPTAETARFQIIKGDEVIGAITAICVRSASGVSYQMNSRSEVSLLWNQVIETAMMARYEGGYLDACGMTVHVNGSMRDSTHLYHDSGTGRYYVHPDLRHATQQQRAWTTARMYFEEPVDVGSIFVESLLEDRTLRRKEAGRYTLILPGNTENHYFYKNGVLQEIMVDRPLFDLIFRRI